MDFKWKIILSNLKLLESHGVSHWHTFSNTYLFWPNLTYFDQYWPIWTNQISPNQPVSTCINPYPPKSTHINPNQPGSTLINPDQPESTINLYQPLPTCTNPNQPVSALHHTQLLACYKNNFIWILNLRFSKILKSIHMCLAFCTCPSGKCCSLRKEDWPSLQIKSISCWMQHLPSQLIHNCIM